VTGSLLPLPDDPRLGQLFTDWSSGLYSKVDLVYPRSVWLYAFEAVLREHYPSANSDSLTLTARSVAPFPLALPNVP
jgi:hypothetical protein